MSEERRHHENAPAHVVVCVSGWQVQDVYANNDVCVEVYDRDSGLTDKEERDLERITREYKHVW